MKSIIIIIILIIIILICKKIYSYEGIAFIDEDDNYKNNLNNVESIKSFLDIPKSSNFYNRDLKEYIQLNSQSYSIL